MEVEAQEQLLPSGSLEGFTRRAALDEVELPATFHLRFVGCMTHGLRKAYRSLAHAACQHMTLRWHIKAMIGLHMAHMEGV